ncbi:hypothetical protein V8E53_008658 [Lactarius tabidus]
MSLESGAYRITNRKDPQLALTLSNDNQRSVIAEGNGPDILQTWIVLDTGEGKVRIMSKANGLFLGFLGMPMPGARLIVVPREIAQIWEVITDEQGYKFKLLNTPFVIQFPDNNVGPGTPAQVAPILPRADNQVWTLRKVDDDDDDDVDDSEDED